MAADGDTTPTSNGDSSSPTNSDDTSNDGTSPDLSSDSGSSDSDTSSSSDGTSSDGASSDSSSDSASSDSGDGSSSDSLANYDVTASIVIGSVDASASPAGTPTAADSTQGAVAAESPGGSGGGGTVSELVNLGLAVWKVMDDGTPNMVPVDQMASGVPSGVSALSQMSNFSSDDKKMQVNYVVSTRGSRNLPLFDPTDLNIVILWRYGGQYQGVGHYVAMANVSVSGKPGTLRHVDITAAFDQPINVGSMTDPVCDLGLNITISNHGAFGSDQMVTNYRASLKGDGSGSLSET